MKKYLLAITVLLVGTYGLWVFNYDAPAPVVTEAVAAPITHPVASEVAEYVNFERDKAGLSRLVDDPRLDASAAAKCTDMNTYGYHAHVSPTGVTWQSFFDSELQHRHIGENLSEYYTSSQATVAGWMGSPAHKANILDGTFGYVGYAVCSTGDSENIVVQHFQG